MDIWRLAFIIIVLAGCTQAATLSAYQDSFQLMWESDLGGNILSLKVVDLNGDGEDEVVTNSLYVTSYGKSGTIYALDKDGETRWKYLAGLLEGSHTTDRGYTIVGAGPTRSSLDAVAR